MRKEKTKKRFRWWHIPVGLVLFILVIITVLLCVMHSMLPVDQNLLLAAIYFLR